MKKTDALSLMRKGFQEVYWKTGKDHEGFDIGYYATPFKVADWTDNPKYSGIIRDQFEDGCDAVDAISEWMPNDGNFIVIA